MALMGYKAPKRRASSFGMVPGAEGGKAEPADKPGLMSNAKVGTLNAGLPGGSVPTYTGNYGNLLFLWDVLFGTAHFSRKYPPAYGLVDDRRHGPESWLTQFIYPIRRSRRAGSWQRSRRTVSRPSAAARAAAADPVSRDNEARPSRRPVVPCASPTPSPSRRKAVQSRSPRSAASISASGTGGAWSA